MSNENLREALQAYERVRDSLFAHCLSNGVFNAWGQAFDCMALNHAHLLAKEALATTEPEPTWMPELPSLPRCMYQNMQHQRMYIGNVYTADQVKAYGEQCWKAGYKHGAWGDKPAVNQQLTTEPVDEREAFEREMSCEEIWGHRSFKKKPDGRYANWCVDLMWDVWQARAAMAQGVK